MQHLFLASYPPWLLSTLMSSGNRLSACSDRATTNVELTSKPPRDDAFASAPYRTYHNSHTHARTVYGERQTSPRFSPSAHNTARSALARCSPPLRVDEQHALSRPPSESRVRVTPRVAVPLPFSDACISNRIAFFSHGCRGISLGEWAKLAERGKTSQGLDDPRESLDELFPNEGQVLFQSHWPGYDPRTCYLDLPAHVAAGERVLTRVDLLDLVCHALVEWVLKITNHRQIECREPEWAIGLKQITFRHVYVTSVVEVKGYVSKWAPVLEIDPRAFQPQCQL